MTTPQPAGVSFDLARLIGGGSDLLRCCTAADREGVREAWQRWQSADDPPTASSFATTRRPQRGMLPLLALRLRDARVQPDRELSTLLRMALVRERRRADAHRAVLFETLDAVGPGAVVLRGPPLAEWAYPDPDTRHSGPLHVLVQRAELDAAAAALSPSVPTVEETRDHVSLEHGSGLPIVVASSLFAGRPHGIDAARIMPYRRIVDVRGRSVASVDPTLTLLELGVLCSSHPGVRHLRWLADAVFVARSGEVDWDRFVETGLSWRLGAVIASTASYLVDDLDADIPHEIPQRLGSATARDPLETELAVAAHREAVGGDLRTLLHHLPGLGPRRRALRSIARPSPEMQRLTRRRVRWNDQPRRAIRAAGRWARRSH